MRKSIALHLFIFALSSVALGNTLSETFSPQTFFNNAGTALVNTAVGMIVPPMQVYQWQGNCGAATNTAISFGDGRHGSFNSSTYNNFGTYSAGILTVDTNRFPFLYVTDFTLNSGDTLLPVGGHPLVIHSLSTIVINGTINCAGSAGQNANASPTTLSSGGSGACGGGNGGSGGITGTAATSGTIGVANVSTVTAGNPATGTAGAGGGGGGGFYWIAPCAGSSGSHGATAGGGGTPGAAGANFDDPGFTNPGGGTGGGGGAASGTYSGAGGGGGGGSIELVSYLATTISNTGVINANGGAGGASASNSGGGGGGAGGSIKIFSGQPMVIGGSANVHVQGGAGGTSGTAGAGGNGGWGRDWVIDSAGDETNGSSIDLADLALDNAGVVQYQTGTFSATSSQYDLSNEHTTFQNLTETVVNGGSGTATLTVAGSTQSGGTPSYIAATNVSSLAGSRYVQFNVSLNNTSATTPIEISGIYLNYTPGSQNQFNYTSGCGLINNGNFDPPNIQAHWPTILALLFFLFLPLLVWWRKFSDYARYHDRPRKMLTKI